MTMTPSGSCFRIIPISSGCTNIYIPTFVDATLYRWLCPLSNSCHQRRLSNFNPLVSLQTPVMVAEIKTHDNRPRRHLNSNCDSIVVFNDLPWFDDHHQCQLYYTGLPIMYKFNCCKSSLIFPPKMIILKLAPPFSANLLTEEFVS